LGDEPNFTTGHALVHFPQQVHLALIRAVPFTVIARAVHCPTHTPHPVHARARRIVFSASHIKSRASFSFAPRATTVPLA